MQHKRYRRSDIAQIVRRTRADLARQVPLEEICESHQVSLRTMRRWLRESEQTSEADSRVTQLERENRRLRRALENLAFDNKVLGEAVRGNF